MINKKQISAAANLVLITAMAMALSGCYSQIPLAVTHPMSTQRKMQAAQHWEVLADDVAEQVYKAFEERDDLKDRPVFVKPPQDSRPFSLVFHELLVSGLVHLGMQVSIEKEDSIVLDYSLLAVKHKYRFQRPKPGMLTALPLGVSVVRELAKVGVEYTYIASIAAGLITDYAIGFYAAESDNEIIITCRLSENNRYVMHTSAIYYINDPDRRLYAGPGSGPAAGPAAKESRLVPVVND